MTENAPRRHRRTPCMDNIWCIVIFMYSAVGTLSWMTEFVSWGQRMFQMTTNLSFVMISVSIGLLQFFDATKVNSTVLGILPLTATLSAGSLVLHMHGPRRNPWAHKVDITAAWFVYVYLAILPAYAFLKLRWPTWHLYHLAILAYFSVTVVILAFSEWSYGNQVVLFILLGAVMYIQLFALRFLKLAQVCDRALPRFARATVDVSVLLATQAISSVLQGDDGVLKQAQSQFRFNVEHGYWHMGCAVVMSIVPMYIIQSLDKKACVALYQRSEIACQGSFLAFQVWLVAASYSNIPSVAYSALTIILQIGLLCISGVCLYLNRNSEPRGLPSTAAAATRTNVFRPERV